MNISKTYQLIYASDLSFTLNVKGSNIRISFAGSVLSPMKVNGRYTTSNQDEIRALEASVRFNKDYRLAKCYIDGKEVPPFEGIPEKKETTGAEPETVKPEPVPQPSAKEPQKADEGKTEDNKQAEAKEPEKQGAVPPDEMALITTVSAARNYLVQKFPGIAKVSLLTNKEKIIHFAKEHSVSFPNL